MPKMEKPLAVFEDNMEALNDLASGEGKLVIYDQDKYSGKIALMSRDQSRFSDSLAHLGVKIRENPAPGEYRYVRFAWKGVRGAVSVSTQFIDDGKHDGGSGKAAKFAYQSGGAPAGIERTIIVDSKGPKDWTVVTRDLFADFGEFTLTGYGVGLERGAPALYDHIYLGRNIGDLDNADVDKTNAADKKTD
jgi:hypothetical protein